ncbi:Zn-dependent alcohol dehydrogenase [Actinophytocola sp.]|uniref:Zn-dependent alcohol dehydrogenase n=1 Tax=Actinophytocola sp. TaxID=1872138 RepID=UPI002ED0937E
MKAAVLNQIGDTKLELRDDVTTTDVGPREIRIRVRATGVCHSDLSAMDGTLPALAPGIVGHEGAGEVVEVGSHVTEFEAGDHAVLTFVPPCGNCVNCVGGRPHLCAVHAIAAFMNPRFKIGDTPVFGYAGTGTFAEELVVPVEGAVKIAHDVPFEIAALVACGVMTGVGAVINTAKVEIGSTVLVYGCGGVGISVIQGARLAGASRIVAVDPLTEKHEAARHFGATHAVTPDEVAGLHASLTESQGFDYAFDVVGAAGTIRAAWDNARRGGTAVVVGAGRGDAMVQFSAQELFLHDKRLLGSFYGGADVRRDYPRLLSLWRAGRLDLDSMISKRITLDEINDGLQALKDGANVIRQIVTF